MPASDSSASLAIPARLIQPPGKPHIRLLVRELVFDAYPHAVCEHLDPGVGLKAGDAFKWGLCSIEPHPRPATWRGWRHAASVADLDRTERLTMSRTGSVTVFFEILDEAAVMEAAAQHLLETNTYDTIEACRLLIDPGSMPGIEIHDSGFEEYSSWTGASTTSPWRRSSRPPLT